MLHICITYVNSLYIHIFIYSFYITFTYIIHIHHIFALYICIHMYPFHFFSSCDFRSDSGRLHVTLTRRVVDSLRSLLLTFGEMCL